MAVALASTAIVTVAATVPSAAAAGAVFCRGWEATMVGTAGPDELHGTADRDVIVGLGGADILYGHGGNDIICGNAGNDVIYGNKGQDRLYGGSGADELRGGWGNDRIWGQNGTDVVYGGYWADLCHGETEYSCEVDYRGERDEEEWRSLVNASFGAIGQTDNALVILACESNGDPFAINPNGSVPVGLFQFIPTTWEWAAGITGWGHETRMHPRAATETARWLYDWSEGRPRRDGSIGQGFDPWVHCRCLLPEYDCQFDTTALDNAGA